MALVTRQGSGALLTQSQGDVNWDTLNGINEAQTGTSHTVDATDELKTIEYSNASAIAVTLTAISAINSANDSQISDFMVTLKNIGVGVVTVTCNAADAFDDGATSITISQHHSITLQTDSTGALWNAVGFSFGASRTDDEGLDSGTSMLFYQAAAPTGWTGSDALSSHAIEIVTATSATGGTSGGTNDFTTVFGLTATDGHVLTIAEMPNHNHSIASASGSGSGTVDDYNGSEQSTYITATGYKGGDGAHTHNIELRVKYAQMIIATKD